MNGEKLGIIIQARTGSTRLKNKMVLPFFENQTVLDVILNRLKSECPVRIIVATSVNPADHAIIEAAERAGVDWFTGDESDVLRRFIDAAEKYDLQKLVRVCADNPLIDTAAINKCAAGIWNGTADYWAYYLPNGTPSIRTHFGFWAEGVSLKALKTIAAESSDKHMREHVTPYIYTNTDKFKIHREEIPPYIGKRTDIRLTLDTMNDFDELSTIYRHFQQNSIAIEPSRIVKYLDEHPEMLERMKSEIQLHSK